MKYLAIAVGIGMAVFTGVSIALADKWAYLVVANVGRFSISTFDLLFFPTVGLLVLANATGMRHERRADNRLVIVLCLAYVGYQLFVVLPAAVLLHDLRPIDVFRQQETRLALLFIPALYLVVLKYWDERVLVALVDIAAVLLAVWVIYEYLAHGAQGYTESGVFRLRAVWGGGILLFGWLLLTSLFYWPLRLWRLLLAGLAIAGIGLANERSGLVAAVAGFLTIVAVVRGVSRRVVIGLVVIVAVSGGVYLSSSTQVRQSVLYSVRTALNPSSDQTAQDRITRSSLGIDYFEQHPLGDYVWNQSFYSINLGNANFVPHDFVVALLDTQGVIAAGLYFAIIGFTVLIAWRNRRDRLTAVMLAYLVLYLTFCLLNANIDLPENISLFFISIALILSRNRSLPDVAALEQSSLPESTPLVRAGSGPLPMESARPPAQSAG